MGMHLVRFEPVDKEIEVPTGTLLSEAARLLNIEISQPCGGQGRCGRCLIRVQRGTLRRRSTLRLTNEDIEQGFALACQSVVENDITVFVPPQEQIERRLSTDRIAAEIGVPDWYFYDLSQSIKRYRLTISPPSLDDQRDDFSRLQTALKKQHDLSNVMVSQSLIRRMGKKLREKDWEITTVISHSDLPHLDDSPVQLIDIIPGHLLDFEPLWGIAVDIGTTTVTLWLVDLRTGEVKVQVSEYNQQIRRGEDVISRIIYASKEHGLEELQNLVISTINELIDIACKRMTIYDVQPSDIYKACIAGNSTMIHLLLGIPPENIRLMPFVTTINDVPSLFAREVGLNISPDGIVDCLPGVASYLGADITAGVYSSGMDETQKVTLFMDVGTNGEIVLGSRDWLVGCACSAGPAFEGAGVVHGMRATKGAIEEVWINNGNFEPQYRVIGGGKPTGLCGSGLISLLAEMFMTGVVDKAGNLNTQLDTPRVRTGEHGLEYVIAWGSETLNGREISITEVDINNLIRAKAAIFAGYTVLAESIGVPLDLIEQMMIGGSFGKYINVEKAVQIGLLPDMPWERFNFLGNTSVRGAYYALLDRNVRSRIQEIASRMTYIELSADNTFYEAFMAALFLPHTDSSLFPTIAAEVQS